MDSTSWWSTSARYGDGKLLIKPSPTAVKRLRIRLATEIRALSGSNAVAVIPKLNPIIQDWATITAVVPSKIFNSLDSYVWQPVYKVGEAHPPQEAEEVDRATLLRQVRQIQERSVSVRRQRRRQRKRRCSPSDEIQSDRHRPTPDGQRCGVPGRP
jgi:hypothetical protein